MYTLIMSHNRMASIKIIIIGIKIFFFKAWCTVELCLLAVHSAT